VRGVRGGSIGSGEKFAGGLSGAYGDGWPEGLPEG
jgi:hypothetical protein